MLERPKDDWRSLIPPSPLRFDTTKPLRPEAGAITRYSEKCQADILLYLVPAIDLRYPAYLLPGDR